MRSFFSVLILASLAFTGASGADATAPGIAAHYESAGADGILTVVAPDGTAVLAVDALGIAVAGGVVQGGMLQAYAANAGPSANGAVLTVLAGDTVFSVGTGAGYPEWWFD